MTKPGDRVLSSWRSAREAVTRLVPASRSARVLPAPDLERHRRHAAVVEACEAARDKARAK